MADETIDPRLAALSLPVDLWGSVPPPPVDSEMEPQSALDLVVDLAELALEEEPAPPPPQMDAIPLKVERVGAAVEIEPPLPAVEIRPPPAVAATPIAAAETVAAVHAPTTSPVPTVAPKPVPVLPESPTLFQAAILVGLPPRRADLEVEELGFRITGALDLAVPWSEISNVRERRGRIVITGPRIRLAFSVGIERIPEPTLAGPFARVLAEAKAGTLDLGGSAFHDLANVTDSLRDRFHEADDPVVTGVLGGVMVLLSALFALVLPDVLLIATQASVPSGAMLISTRLSSIDPRILVAALGAAGLLASIAGRVALGAQAGAWARGTLRGWQRSTLPGVGVLSRGLAAVVWFPGLAAALVLLGVASAAPSARAQTIVAPSGVLMMRELPFLDSHHPWSSVTQILETPAPMDQDRHVEGIAVVIHFTDGSPLNTYDLKIRNGTDGQLSSLSRRWREAATAP